MKIIEACNHKDLGGKTPLFWFFQIFVKHYELLKWIVLSPSDPLSFISTEREFSEGQEHVQHLI